MKNVYPLISDFASKTKDRLPIEKSDGGRKEPMAEHAKLVRDGGKVNIPLNPPIDLLIIFLFAVTKIIPKDIKSFLGMSLAAGNDILRMKQKATLNSIIMHKNIDFVDAFMKWLAMLTISPPVRYRIIESLGPKTQNHQSSLFPYLFYLINTILNITLKNITDIRAISYSKVSKYCRRGFSFDVGYFKMKYPELAKKYVKEETKTITTTYDVFTKKNKACG